MPTWLDKILNSQIVQLGLAALAFLIALWLVIVIVRLLMGGRLRLPGGRTRQARLGIVDAFDLDRQRQLIIVRRDNVEHLIRIGGTNDLVVESEIVRVESRDLRDRRDKNFDAFNDARAPSSLGAVESQGQLAGGVGRGDDLGGALPIAASAPPASPQAMDPPRAPTFPLPPRRPVERRSPPPLASERPYRNEPSYAPEPPPLSAVAQSAPAPQSLAPAPTLAPVPAPASAPPPRPAPMSPSAQPVTLGSASSPEARQPAVAPRPSPFLKSMPPRPPARPLRRVTPQGEAGGPVPSGAAPSAAAGPQSLQPVSSVPPTQPEKDGLASLEEEMAKLLGR